MRSLGTPSRYLQDVGVHRLACCSKKCPCAFLMGFVLFGRSCQAELSSRLTQEQAVGRVLDAKVQLGTGESRRPGERPGEEELIKLQKWVQGVGKQQEASEQATCLSFIAERTQVEVIWKWTSSQTVKFNVKILAQGKHLKHMGRLDFNCSRVSQQLLIPSKWEVLGSGRCLWLKIQSCRADSQSGSPASLGLWLPLPTLQSVGTSSVLPHCALEQGLNQKPSFVP